MNVDLVAVVSEVNMISNVKGWWVDTRATRHICGDKNLFSEFTPITSGEKTLHGKFLYFVVEGKGTVLLKFTFGKIVTLVDILFVLEIRKMLVFGPLHSKKSVNQKSWQLFQRRTFPIVRT